ncbi:MAG: cyclic nucleotide-binding domain-containing protein [Deltaproteobacteria bacterium]|nr:cyclic nucleotide-binding domain-containing protein [Deltaproteobacteria bacterium]
MIESKFLKDNLQNIQKLMDLAPLKSFETKSLRQLLQLSKIREYKDSERIIMEGAADPWLYFILSGKVRIKKDGETIVTLNKVGEFFGEMRILDGLHRSASVFAEGRTICLAVDTSATGRLASDDERANFLLLLYRMFSEYISIRLRITNDELIKAKKKAALLAKKLNENK